MITIVSGCCVENGLGRGREDVGTPSEELLQGSKGWKVATWAGSKGRMKMENSEKIWERLGMEKSAGYEGHVGDLEVKVSG